MKNALIICLFLFTCLSTNAQTDWYDKGTKTDDNLLKVEYFTKALANGKTDRWTYYKRGWAYIGLKKYHHAIQDFKDCMEAKGNLDDTYIHTGLGWAYYDVREYEKAEFHALESLKGDIQSSSAYSILGWVNLNQGRTDKAIEYLDKYVSENPDKYAGYADRSYAHSLAGNYSSVVKDCDMALKLNPGYDKLIRRKALALIRLGKRDEGLELIKNEIAFDPEHPRSFKDLGDLFYSVEDYNSAIHYYDKGISLYNQKIKEDSKYIDKFSGDIYNIYTSKGDAHELLEQWQNALAAYTSATRIEPDNHYAWREIGETQTFQENYREAVRAYEKAFQLKPDLTSGWTNLGFSYSKLGQEEKAIEAYTRGIKVDPENGLLFNNRGYAYLVRGEYDKAKADIEEAMRVEPDLVMAHVSYGEYFYEVSEYEKAVVQLKKTAKMEGGSSTAYYACYYELGNAYYQLGKFKEALESYKEALIYAPDDAVIFQQIGICHFELKEYCPAYTALKKAISIDNKSTSRSASSAARYLGKMTRNPCN